MDRYRGDSRTRWWVHSPSRQLAIPSAIASITRIPWMTDRKCIVCKYNVYRELGRSKQSVEDIPGAMKVGLLRCIGDMHVHKQRLQQSLLGSNSVCLIAQGFRLNSPTAFRATRIRLCTAPCTSYLFKHPLPDCARRLR